MPAGADRTGKSCERGIGGLMQRRPLHIETVGTEHQPVHAGMRLRKGDIGLGAGHCLLRQRGAGRGGSRHRGAELPVTDGGEFADEAGQVAEMMGRCGVRDAGLARHRAQRQSRQPVALQHPFGRLEQRAAQRAVMVRRGFPCPGRPRCASFPRCPRRRNIIVRIGPGPDSGGGGLSCHFGLIGRYFYTVKISLDDRCGRQYRYLYDVKINPWSDRCSSQ